MTVNENINHLSEKIDHLKEILTEMKGVVVAYSGGVDSTFLLKMAFDVLKTKVCGVTLVSETMPEQEITAAKIYAHIIGVPHRYINTHEMKIKEYTSNPPDRCYYCKIEHYTRLLAFAEREGYLFIADGTNYDDPNDHRPGLRAGQELGIRSPLREAMLTKEDIRFWSEKTGLPTWDKASAPCLASRIPYGEIITAGKIRQVEYGEKLLAAAGFSRFRLRHHGKLARIEIPPEEFSRAVALNNHLSAELKKLGFNYITLDLTGFRSGSMNEVI